MITSENNEQGVGRGLGWSYCLVRMFTKRVGKRKVGEAQKVQEGGEWRERLKLPG